MVQLPSEDSDQPFSAVTFPQFAGGFIAIAVALVLVACLLAQLKAVPPTSTPHSISSATLSPQVQVAAPPRRKLSGQLRSHAILLWAKNSESCFLRQSRSLRLSRFWYCGRPQGENGEINPGMLAFSWFGVAIARGFPSVENVD